MGSNSGCASRECNSSLACCPSKPNVDILRADGAVGRSEWILNSVASEIAGTLSCSSDTASASEGGCTAGSIEAAGLGKSEDITLPRRLRQQIARTLMKKINMVETRILPSINFYAHG